MEMVMGVGMLFVILPSKQSCRVWVCWLRKSLHSNPRGISMIFKCCAFILTVLSVLASSSQAAVGKRVALVIGNGSYTTVSRLTNPVNDAKAMAAMLKQCGFEVLLYTDLDLNGMDNTVKEFAAKIPGIECALFFYAGHGLQKDGNNYLVPVNREPETEGQIRSRCLNAEEILSVMERSAAGVNILILDACRNNPLPADSRYISRGLAQMQAPTGSLIAFSTAPGKEASDGAGMNSPFTKSLLKHLPTPGLDVEQVLKRVTDDVLEQTGTVQTPWRQSSLRREFYFVPGSGDLASVTMETPTPQHVLSGNQSVTPPKQYVLNIRSGVPQLTNIFRRFEDQGDGTILDTHMNLEWQKLPPQKTMSWKEAADYCASLDISGKKDWRLPTSNELLSLTCENNGVTYSLNNDFFDGIPITETYWTVTKTPMTFRSHEAVRHSDATVNSFDNNNFFAVRAVRNRR